MCSITSVLCFLLGHNRGRGQHVLYYLGCLLLTGKQQRQEATCALIPQFLASYLGTTETGGNMCSIASVACFLLGHNRGRRQHVLYYLDFLLLTGTQQRQEATCVLLPRWHASYWDTTGAGGNMCSITSVASFLLGHNRGSRQHYDICITPSFIHQGRDNHVIIKEDTA